MSQLKMLYRCYSRQQKGYGAKMFYPRFLVEGRKGLEVVGCVARPHAIERLHLRTIAEQNKRVSLHLFIVYHLIFCIKILYDFRCVKL